MPSLRTIERPSNFIREALALRRQTNDPDGEATSLTNLGEAYAKLGETEKARDHFERALAILRISANRHKLVRALRGLGALSRNDRRFRRVAGHASTKP